MDKQQMKDEDTHKDLFLCLEVVLADATKAVVDLEGLNGFHGAPLLKGCLCLRKRNYVHYGPH